MSAAKPVEILLAEDDANDAEMTIRALKRHNLANVLVRVKDGVEALDFLLNGSSPPPRLILLDVKMPKVDGLEVLRRLRGDARTKDVPVVMLTSSKEDPDVQAAYDLGANSYIVKPVDFQKFQDAVAQIGFYWLVLNQPPR